ncbi:tetratricopeptide repeat protein [bacterium]|nr:tetratricopeptide repeat protein [bacterium]MBP9810219.1 tetratricopeptide repeat protein [bacterium]
MIKHAINFNRSKTQLHLTSTQFLALSIPFAIAMTAQLSMAPCSAAPGSPATTGTTPQDTVVDTNSDTSTDNTIDTHSGSIKIPYRVPPSTANAAIKTGTTGKTNTTSAAQLKPSYSADSWEQLESQGEKAAYNCEYGEAERLLKSAVEKARNFPAGDLRLAKSSGELGRLLAIRGRFSEAEPLLEEELAVKTVASGGEDEHLIPAMTSMVRFYLLHETAAKANPLAEKVLSFVEGKLNEARSQAQGKVTLQAGQPLQAWAGEASAVMRDPLIEWAIACDEIGNIYATRSSSVDSSQPTSEDSTLAERLFTAALNVKSTVLGAHHLSLANSYDSLGGLALTRKDYEEAEANLKDALDITERIQPPENFQVYARLDKLGKCLLQENKLAEAEALYLRAQDFWKNAPSKNGNEARAAFALANIYAQEKKYAEAAPLFEKALQIAEQNSGPDSVALVPYLDRYAYVLYYLGMREQTDELRARAQAITDGNTSITMSKDPAVGIQQ